MKKAVVTANKINVREGRAQTYPKLGSYYKNQIITVLDDELDEKYAKVLWQQGYAYSDMGKHITFIDPPDMSGNIPNAVVTAGRISVRRGRNISYAKLGEYKRDDQIIVLDKALDQAYSRVLWQQGYTYSAEGEHIQFIEGSAEANAVVTANRISVRTGRGETNEKLGEYKKGDAIVVLDDTLNFEYVHVVFEDTTGYAYCDYGKYIKYIEEPPAEDYTNAVVTASRISVRDGRGVEYAKLGEFSGGDEITVLDDTLNYDYVHVVWQNGDGYAYCDFGKYIKFTDEQEIDDGCCRDTVPNAVITANLISVREGRGVGYKKLGEFKKGDKIVVLDETLDYDYVAVAFDGQIAYAYCDYGMHVSFINTDIPSEIKSAIDIAKSCVGGKYIYGAQGTKITESYVKRQKSRYPEYFTGGRYAYLLDIGRRCDASGVWQFPDDYAWDCSGLWWYSANKAGVYGKNLDTTANTFYHSYCTPIKKSELRAGDAVFYKNSSGRVTHMGVVGEGGVVHEAMSGYVGVVTGNSVNDRTAPRIVGTGTYTRLAWNAFGRPKIFK